MTGGRALLPMLQTWEDFARSEAWYALGEDISFDLARFLLWEKSCFPFGTKEQVRAHLELAFLGLTPCARCGLSMVDTGDPYDLCPSCDEQVLAQHNASYSQQQPTEEP